MSTRIVLSEIIDLEDLPSPPSVAARILDLYSDATISNKDLASAIGADPVLAARVMTYANTRTVNSESEVSTLIDAIELLGARVIKTIALSFSLKCPKIKPDDTPDMDAFWNCSLVRAVAAKVLCQRFSQEPELGFLAGLMMEIGEMAIRFSKKPLKQILTENPQLGTTKPFAICHANDQFDYYQFGGLLLREWKFPVDVIESVSTLCTNARPTQFQKTLMLAAGIGKMIFDDLYEYDQIQKVKDFAANEMQLQNDQFEDVFAQVLDTWIANPLSLHFDSANRSIQEIEKEAKKQIMTISLDLQQENNLIAEENELLREQASVDQLTGLGNRRSWEQIARFEWQRSIHLGDPFSLMVVDVDHFKCVNDKFGHAIGDRVLVHIATLLKNGVRKYDQIFRFGGDEFVIILPQRVSDTIENVASRLLTSIEKTPVHFAGRTIQVTVSIGVSQWKPEMQSDLDQLFDAADRQLYIAKSRGRNQYCICESETIGTSSDA